MGGKPIQEKVERRDILCFDFKTSKVKGGVSPGCLTVDTNG